MEWKEFYEDKCLKPHAFSGRMDLTETKLLPDTEEIGAYAFSECRNLEQAVLPERVRRVGAHAFYNCRGLKKLVLPGQLAELEDGAFKNCSGLAEIVVKAADPMRLHVDLLLFEITQCVRVMLEFTDGTGVFVFPAYHYGYVANEPARIFSEVSYGSGYYFRECFRQDRADFDGYDSYFETAVREEEFTVILALAEGRILFPYRLSEEAGDRYIEWLRKHVGELAVYHAKRKEPEQLEELHRAGVLTGKWLDEALERVLAAGETSCTAGLLRLKQQTGERKGRRYEL